MFELDTLFLLIFTLQAYFSVYPRGVLTERMANLKSYK